MEKRDWDQCPVKLPGVKESIQFQAKESQEFLQASQQPKNVWQEHHKGEFFPT